MLDANELTDRGMRKGKKMREDANEGTESDSLPVRCPTKLSLRINNVPERLALFLQQSQTQSLLSPRPGDGLSVASE